MVTLAFAQAGSILAFKNPYKWTGGEEGFGVDYHKLPAWTVGILNTKHLYWIALGYAAAVFVDRAVGRVVVARSRVAGDPRERAARAGARPAAVRVQADVVRARLDARDGGRRRLPAAPRRRDDRGDDGELHADAAADGRDRRHRHALGRDDRRHPLHLRRPPARRPLVLAARSRRCRRSSARRCSSRCSSSACSSSSSCSSCRAASRRSTACAGRRRCNDSRRRSDDEDPLGFARRRARRCS